MKTRFLVVDDEPLARKLVVSHASKIPGLECAGQCGSAVEAIELLRTTEVDLLFLDIHMPELGGFELIRTLKNPPSIIFTTAFREYAPEAFDIDAVDYLLKPISFERLLKATNKYFDRRTSSNAVDASNTPIDPSILIKADRKLHKVMLEDIVYIESLDDFIKIHLKGKVLISRENISTIETKLPKEGFVRIHRSYIVNLKHLTAFGPEGVDIKGKILPFGRTFKQGAMTAMGMK
jgi:DNA-binding LytR/AlgR family response regulator